MSVATSIISGSVGRGGLNRRPDVELVQRLLNLVPFPKGGPTPLLATDSLCGPKTCAAISRFQLTQLKAADGRIDPGYRTMQTLLALLSQLGLLQQVLPGYGSGLPGTGPNPGTTPLPTVPGATGLPAGLSPLRTEIVKWANIGAKGPYGDVGGAASHGIVSDLDIVPEHVPSGRTRMVRRGWKNLQEFLNVAVHNWNTRNWLHPEYEEGSKVPGKRMPVVPGSKFKIHWCGIFGTWCWIKAGKNTKWISGVGPTNAKKITGAQGIEIGDMCVQYGDVVHHFLVIAINGDDITCVNGNSDAQSILVKTVKRATIQYFYKAE